MAVNGSGRSFIQEIIDPEIHRILEFLQTHDIDTKDKKQMFNINKSTFVRFQENYEKIVNFEQKTKLITHDLTLMTTFVNRFLKKSVIGCGVSIPVT